MPRTLRQLAKCFYSNAPANCRQMQTQGKVFSWPSSVKLQITLHKKQLQTSANANSREILPVAQECEVNKLTFKMQLQKPCKHKPNGYVSHGPGVSSYKLPSTNVTANHCERNVEGIISHDPGVSSYKTTFTNATANALQILTERGTFSHSPGVSS